MKVKSKSRTAKLKPAAKKTKKKKMSKTAGKLVTMLAKIATTVQVNAIQTQTLLATVVQLVTQDSGYTSTPSENNPLQDAVNDQFLQDIIDQLSKGTSTDEFTAPCKLILEGMREAIKAGDNLGAAHAYMRYVTCMSRPRPKVVGEH